MENARQHQHHHTSLDVLREYTASLLHDFLNIVILNTNALEDVKPGGFFEKITDLAAFVFACLFAARNQFWDALGKGQVNGFQRLFEQARSKFPHFYKPFVMLSRFLVARKLSRTYREQSQF